MPKLPITVLMITLNEEYHLPDAIENVGDWAQEIFIVDSCSSDRTVDIALEKGVQIVQRPFTNFGDQWNFAIFDLPIKTPWTLKLDPDERLSPELKKEISDLVAGNPECSGYVIDRRLWFMGKPLHVKTPVPRLWRSDTCRFADVTVNEHPIIEGKLGKLRGHMEHHDSRDLHHWYEKQNRYSTMEAIMQVRGEKLATRPNLFGSALQRRMFIKKYFYKVPFRYQILWLYLFIFEGAFLDGFRGGFWASLRVEVYRMVELKVKEIRATGLLPNLPKPAEPKFDPRLESSSLQLSAMKSEKKRKADLGPV